MFGVRGVDGDAGALEKRERGHGGEFAHAAVGAGAADGVTAGFGRFIGVLIRPSWSGSGGRTAIIRGPDDLRAPERTAGRHSTDTAVGA